MPSQQVDLIYFIQFFKYNKQASIFYIDQIMFVSRMNKMNKHELNSKGKPKKGIRLSNSLSSQQLQISIRHIEPSIVQQIKKKTVKCPVCFGDYEQTQMKLFGNCMHSFCSGCIQYRINFELKTKKPIKCMMAQCAQILASQSPHIQTLTPSIIKQYANVMKLYNNPNLRKCPTQQCSDFFNIKSKDLTCKSCQTKFCKKCLNPSHKGSCLAQCAKYLQYKFGYKLCKCNQMVQKSDGCNHMICRCGYHFCYNCGKKWSKPHACISQVAQNPQNRPNDFNNNRCSSLKSFFAMLLAVVLGPIVFFISFQFVYTLVVSLPLLLISIPFFVYALGLGFLKMKRDYSYLQIVLGNIFLYFYCYILELARIYREFYGHVYKQSALDFFFPLSYHVVIQMSMLRERL